MPAENIAWLDVGLREDSKPAILDHGRLRQVVSALPDPENQFPSLCVFIGKKAKQTALQELYSLNNIKRHVSEANIRLGYDVFSSESRHPVLFADSDNLQDKMSFPSRRLQAGIGYATSWACSAKTMLLITWTRFIFLLTDVICLFLEDEPSIKEAVRFLISCSRFQAASSFSVSIRPRVILIFADAATQEADGISHSDLLDKALEQPKCANLLNTFSNISSFSLKADHLSSPARHERMRSALAKELDEMRVIRQRRRFQPNVWHLTALFESALRHLIVTTDRPFDIVSAVREDRPISPNIQFPQRLFMNNPYKYLYERARIQIDYLISLFTRGRDKGYNPSVYALHNLINKLEPNLFHHSLFSNGKGTVL